MRCAQRRMNVRLKYSPSFGTERAVSGTPAFVHDHGRLPLHSVACTIFQQLTATTTHAESQIGHDSVSRANIPMASRKNHSRGYDVRVRRFVAWSPPSDSGGLYGFSSTIGCSPVARNARSRAPHGMSPLLVIAAPARRPPRVEVCMQFGVLFMGAPEIAVGRQCFRDALE